MAKYKETWRAADVMCPFFLGERSGGKDVVCEGWENRMKITVEFSTYQAKDAYMGRHCVGPYKRCRIYQETMKKYEIE